jgi:hypothetical protein
MGMETGLLSFLLLLGIYFAIRFINLKKKRSMFLSAFFFGLAFLTRNDSVIYAGTSFMLLFLSLYREGTLKNILRTIIVGVIIFSIFIIGQFLFRYLYYGEFVPNTYILKLVGMPLIIRLFNGYIFLEPFLVSLLPLLIIVVLDILTDKGKYKIYLLLMLGLALAYQIYVGGDPWRYWRMIAPIMPLFIILFCTTIYNFFDSVKKTSLHSDFGARNEIISTEYYVPLFTIVILLGAIYHLNQPFFREALLLDDAYSVDANYYNVNKAIILNDITTDDATIGVSFAGAIPYYVDRLAIDFLGKSDKKIAKMPPDLTGAVGWNGMKSVPGHNKYDLEYSIVELQPTYVQTFVWGKDNLTEWRDTKYTTIKYKGVVLHLKTDSPHVHWDKLEEYR